MLLGQPKKGHTADAGVWKPGLGVLRGLGVFGGVSKFGGRSKGRVAYVKYSATLTAFILSASLNRVSSSLRGQEEPLFIMQNCYKHYSSLRENIQEH